MTKRNKILTASAIAIMLAPAALSLTQQTTQASGLVGFVGTIRRDAGQVVDDNGNITQTTLPNFTSWKLGQTKQLRGKTYYQVGTNQWVAFDSMDISKNGNQVGYYAANYNPNVHHVATVAANTPIVNGYGQNTGRTLTKGSTWQLGQITTFNNEAYFEVGTNEWIPASYVTNLVSGDTEKQAIPTQTQTATKKVGTLSSTVSVYGSDGKPLGITLKQGTKWQLGDLVTIGGTKMYQVATNEYIDATFVNIPGEKPFMTTNPDKVRGQNGTIIFSNSQIVTAAGIATGVKLPEGTSWKLGETIRINGVEYYEVGTNQYVTARDFLLKSAVSTSTSTSTTTTTTNPGIPTPGNGLVATTTKQQAVYNSETNTYGQVLQANTSWKIAKLVVNKYGAYWGQVSNNEWVFISNVRLNSGLNLKTYAYSEPEFAVSINK